MITAHIEDALLPSAIDDVFVNMTVGIPPTTQPAGSPSLLHYFVETVKLYQILKEVHRLCGERTQQPAPVSARIQVVMELYKRAIEWMEQVPPSYKHGWNDVDVPNNNSSAQRTQEQRAGSSEPLKSSDLSRRLYYRYTLAPLMIQDCVTDTLQFHAHCPIDFASKPRNALRGPTWSASGVR